MPREHSMRVDFAQLKRVVPLTAILSRYGLDDAFERVGTRLRGVCPIHKGSNKRQFVIDPNASTWRCFGDCNRGGAALEFVAAMEGVGITEAALMIAEWFAVSAPMRVKLQPKQRRHPVSGKPSHKVFVVEDREEAESGDDDKAWWTRVGSAWPHADGRGLNVVLSALPVGGRLVLREYTDEDAKRDDEQQKKKRKK